MIRSSTPYAPERRSFGDKLYQLASTTVHRDEADGDADDFRSRHYRVRVVPVSGGWAVYTRRTKDCAR